MMKILLKCTRRPQVEVVEVEEDTVEVEVGITHPVEMVKKMEMKSVTLEGKERLDQMENSLNIQMNTTKIMQDILVMLIVDQKKMERRLLHSVSMCKMVLFPL